MGGQPIGPGVDVFEQSAPVTGGPWWRRAGAWLRIFVCGTIVTMAATGGSPSWAADPAPPEQAERLVVVDIGDGFALDAGRSGPYVGIGYQRVFTRADAELTLIGSPRQSGLSEDTAIAFLARFFGSDGEPLDLPGNAQARAFRFVDPRIGAAYVAVFVARDGLFVAVLRPDPGATFDAVPVLERVVERQTSQAGGTGPSAPSQGSDGSPLDPLLLDTAPPVAGLTFDAGPAVSGTETGDRAGLERSTGAFLARHSVSRARTWVSTDSSVAVVVSVVRYPYDLFAAAALDWQRSVPDTRSVVLPAVTDRNVVVYEGLTRQAPVVGGVFRRGRLLFDVLVLTQPGPVEAEPAAKARRRAVVVAFLDAQTAQAPAGPRSAYRLPSPEWAGVVSGIAIVVLGACWTAGVHLGAHRRRPGRTAVASAVSDVSSDAHRLRAAGVWLLLGQLAMLGVAAGGVVAFEGAAAVGSAVVPPMLGVALTRWRRRAELARVRGDMAGRRRPTRQVVLAGAIGGLALAALTGGATLGVSGVRAVVGLPTVRLLRAADALGAGPRATGGVAVIAALALAVVGAMAFRSARARARADALALRSRDPRPPILYLRSFGDDRVRLPVVVSARRPFVELFRARASDPFEEAVTWELAPFGPVIAVGRPGEGLATLGAAREELTDESWRDEVLAIMAEARALIVSIGDSPGIEWEIRALVRHGHLPKTLFLFPPEPPDELARRWTASIATIVGAGGPSVDAPVDLSTAHIVALAPTGGLVAFAADRRDEATYRAAVDRAFTELLAREPQLA